MRIIDADALIEKIKLREGGVLGYREIFNIEEMPTLDVAPVVHAHWIKTFGSDGFVSTLRCSECGNAENATCIPGNFCWFCGANMDGEAE